MDDALNGMTKRQLEDLRGRIDKRLQACAIDGNDGAVPVRATARRGKGSVAFTLLMCPSCIERHRLPEGRAEVAGQ